MKRRTPSSTVPGVVKTVRRRRRRPPAVPGADPDRPTAPGRARPAPRRASTLPPGVPERLGPYRLLTVLGEGGMGTVYLAEETESLRRRVAVKWIRAALVGEHARRRFDAERRALARMNHPSIAQVFAAGTDVEGRPYIVMEHVAGARITEYRERRQPPYAVLLGLLADLGRGLLHAHRQGIVHRDVKPSNVLVAEDPLEGPTPKIIDFGLAKLLDATLQLTRPGDVLGTPAYMSPEQLRGEAVDHRTDVYSFGVLVRELVTGDPEGALEAASCPPELGRIVEACVAARPEDRYGDFAAIVDDLEALKSREAGGRTGAGDDDLGEDLARLFEDGASRSAERLLDIFEAASARSSDALVAAVAEAGRLHDAHRRTNDARRRLAEASAELHLGAALTEFVLGEAGDEARERFQAAAALFQEVFETVPEALTAIDHVEWGDALLQLSEPESEELEHAAAAYRRALELDGRSAAARYGLALSGLRGLAPPDDWSGAAGRVLALAPRSAPAHNHLGIVLWESRRHPEISLFGRDKLTEAIAAFEKALGLDPERAAVHFNLGIALAARGQTDRARKAFRQARRLGLDAGQPGTLAAAVEDGEIGPVEILPLFDCRLPDEAGDEAAELYRRGCARARDDPRAARAAFVRAAGARRRPEIR